MQGFPWGYLINEVFTAYVQLYKSCSGSLSDDIRDHDYSHNTQDPFRVQILYFQKNLYCVCFLKRYGLSYKQNQMYSQSYPTCDSNPTKQVSSLLKVEKFIGHTNDLTLFSCAHDWLHDIYNFLCTCMGLLYPH